MSYLSSGQHRWLIAAICMASLPHWIALPLWLGPLAALGLGWHLLGRRRLGGRVLKALLLAVLAGIFVHYGTLLGIAPLIAILCSCLVLKLLESRHLGEAVNIIYLNIYLAVLVLLNNQVMTALALVLATIVVQLAALHRLFRAPGGDAPGPSAQGMLYFTFKMLLASLPLAAFLFVAMPRIPAFWIMPMKPDRAASGLASTMSPGDIAGLSLSDAVAFRVEFEGPPPDPRTLYWRSLVMSRYNGRIWSQSPLNLIEHSRRNRPDLLEQGQRRALEGVERRGATLSYQIYLEPTQRPFVYSLASARSDDKRLYFTRDLLLRSLADQGQRLSYKIISSPQYSHQAAGLDTEVRSENLYLPVTDNSRALQLAAQWRARGLSGAQMAAELSAMINADFVYSLSPGTYGEAIIDEFLFERRRGYCEHYAQAAVFLLRAAGVPARVVAGYMGGEPNPYTGHLVVTQARAHAWTEYWQAGRGWVRYDPTAAVAAHNIENEVVESLATNTGASLWSQLGLRLESINHRLVRWVVHYNKDSRQGLLQSLFGKSFLKGLVIFVAAALVLVFAVLYLSEWWRTRPRPRSAAQRQLAVLRAWLAGRGRQWKPSDTPAQLVQMGRAAVPEQGALLARIGELMETCLFRHPTAQHWRQMEQALRALRRGRR